MSETSHGARIDLSQRPVPITYIQFGTLTADEWRAIGIPITKPSNRGSQDVEGTPYDLRLGALENGMLCERCGEKNSICPGHWGYIELEEPCYNPEFINAVLGILKCVCQVCAAPRIPESLAANLLSLQRNSRFKAYRKKAEVVKKCGECEAALPSYFLDKAQIKQFYDDRKRATAVTAREAHSILLKVTDATMKLLGFNHELSENPVFMDEELCLPQNKIHVHQVKPESFIFVVLPVMPTCARPWVVKGSERKDDDITDKYNTILKLNAKVKAERDGVPVKSKRNINPAKQKKKLKETLISELHINIWSLIDNSKEKSKSNARKSRGIRERLVKKGGHFQMNVAGKRSDFTARTVIVGGGSILRMGEIGVPEEMAKVLTSPELILDWNFKEMTKMLREMKINTVCRQGFVIDVNEVTTKGTKPFIWKGKEGLQLGDIVHRHLRTGDVGIFNRQPTLRIESMQGIKVVILPDEYTFRLPLGMTRPLNAD